MSLSNLPLLHDFVVQRGNSFEQDIFLFYNPSSFSAPIDFLGVDENAKIPTDGMTVSMNIRKGGKFVKRLTGDEITIQKGRIRISLSASATQALKPDKYQYELTVNSGQSLTFIKGFFRIVIDNDISVKDVVIVGTFDEAFILNINTNRANQNAPNSGNGNGQHTPQGIIYQRLFYKTPNGKYFIQYMTNEGEITWREENPAQYQNAIIFLPPQ